MRGPRAFLLKAGDNNLCFFCVRKNKKAGQMTRKKREKNQFGLLETPGNATLIEPSGAGGSVLEMPSL